MVIDCGEWRKRRGQGGFLLKHRLCGRETISLWEKDQSRLLDFWYWRCLWDIRWKCSGTILRRGSLIYLLPVLYFQFLSLYRLILSSLSTFKETQNKLLSSRALCSSCSHPAPSQCSTLALFTSL